MLFPHGLYGSVFDGAIFFFWIAMKKSESL
jgi:hypothetical protein